MKTEKETSILEEKKAMIQELIGIIDKNTSSKNDVWYLVKGIKEFSEFFAEQRLLHNAQIFKESRVIMSQISKSGYNNYMEPFTKMAEAASTAMIIAGQNAEALSLFSNMGDDLSGVLS